MDFNKVCRTCLGTDSLYPIFSGIEDDEKCSLEIYNSTGIKVLCNDGLPQNICLECSSRLNDNIKFRIKCHMTEKELLKLIDVVHDTKDIFANNLELDKTQGPLENFHVKIENRTESVIVDATTLNLQIENSEEKNIDEKTEKNIDEKTEKIKKNNYDHEISNDSIDLHTDSYVIVIDDTTKHKRKKIRTEKKLDIIADITTDNGETKRVMCKLCSKNLSIRSIQSHMISRHPEADNRRTKCEMCDRMLLKDRMKKHCALIHGMVGVKPKKFLCGYCKFSFKSKEEVTVHVSTCTARKKRKIISERGREMVACDTCGKMMQQASLRHHKAVAHSGLGPVCEHCGKRFANKIRLNEHCRAKHGYEKYKCSYCDFRSASLMAMRNHERRHRGEKPFVCETCGAKFHAAYLLAQHKQTHRRDKLIKCDLCPASFKANNSLHMHKITCHSKSTYKCYLCERIFNCRHYVVKHLRHFHGYQGKVGHIEKVEGKLLCDMEKLEGSSKEE